MKIYGYDNDGNFVDLKEATIECSADELKNLSDFLTYAESLHNSENIRDKYCHSHYSDWYRTNTSLSENTVRSSSDLIIITNIDKC